MTINNQLALLEGRGAVNLHGELSEGRNNLGTVQGWNWKCSGKMSLGDYWERTSRREMSRSLCIGQIHIRCLKIYPKICLKIILRQKL